MAMLNNQMVNFAKNFLNFWDFCKTYLADGFKNSGSKKSKQIGDGSTLTIISPHPK